MRDRKFVLGLRSSFRDMPNQEIQANINGARKIMRGYEMMTAPMNSAQLHNWTCCAMLAGIARAELARRGA